MAELGIIIGSGLAAGILYLFFFVQTKKEWFQSYIRSHFWLRPNAICVERTVFAILATIIYFKVDNIYGLTIAIFVYTIASIMDGLDGMVARRCGLDSDFGKWFDPLCDKISYLVPLFFFAYYWHLSMAMVIILCVLEFSGQFIVRAVLHNKKKSMSANWTGKVKATLCFVLVIYCAAANSGLSIPDFTNFVLFLCVLLSFFFRKFKSIAGHEPHKSLSGLY